MRPRLVIAAATLALSACGDSSGPKPVPTSIDLVTAPSGAATAGVPLTTSPAFVVKDQDGKPMSGVAVTITVTAGGGSLDNAPSKTSGSTSVGTWILGKTV